ncbi:MAG: hypothetical protein HRF50_15945 [Phycisphaerae bacterium]|jgi:hypothetical protein
MSKAQHTVQAKVLDIFRELAGDRARRLAGDRHDSEINDKVAEAMASECDAKVASDIGFHLTDWNSDAAFLVALHLFPERFAPEEVKAGVMNLVVHAPNHLAAAAKLAGHPVEDVFGLGALAGG